MSDFLVATVAFNVPWAIREQIRLFHANLLDDHELLVFDNSTDPAAAASIRGICFAAGTKYVPVPTGRHEHPDALNLAAATLADCDSAFIGFVDHDVFPAKPTALGPLIAQAGFLGIGQRHGPTGYRYIKPSFAWFSRDWLDGRTLNFGGIRGPTKEEDGDCASMLWPLFLDVDWNAVPPMKHGYRHVREMDDAGLQSWAVEVFGDDDEWLHLFNLSRWLAVPEPDERERLVRELVEAL